MNRKLIGVLLLLAGLILAYFTYRGIFVTRAGMLNVVLSGALAGALVGGATTMFQKKK